jgi:hypothetical protein
VHHYCQLQLPIQSLCSSKDRKVHAQSNRRDGENEMEKVLKKYYQKASFPTVYGDGMIPNPRTKLITFEEESRADTNAEEDPNACRRRFIQMYDQSNVPAAGTVSVSVVEKIPSSTGANKRSAAHHADPEYRQVLLNHSSKRRHNDYDRYIKIPDDPDIPSGLG